MGARVVPMRVGINSGRSTGIFRKVSKVVTTINFGFLVSISIVSVGFMEASKFWWLIDKLYTVTY